jgi:hypothetical protein
MQAEEEKEEEEEEYVYLKVNKKYIKLHNEASSDDKKTVFLLKNNKLYDAHTKKICLGF